MQTRGPGWWKHPGAWPFECCTQRVTHARQTLLACWRLSVEAGGGQGGKATLRADTWRSFRLVHATVPISGAGVLWSQIGTGHRPPGGSPRRSSSFALLVLSFLSSCIHTLCFCTHESRVCQAAGHGKACTAVQSACRSESGGGGKLSSYRPRTGQSRQGVIQRQLPG